LRRIVQLIVNTLPLKAIRLLAGGEAKICGTLALALRGRVEPVHAFCVEHSDVSSIPPGPARNTPA